MSLHYLKYTHDLSDEAVLRGWVENPYWQYLSGMEFFCHEPPIDPSSMSRWRSRVGEAGGEELLRQTIEAGLRTEDHQAQRAEAGERRHHRAGEAHPLPDGSQALRPDAPEARRGGPKGGRRAQAVIRAGGQAPARPAEPLRPRQTMETGASMHAQATHHPGQGHPRHRAQTARSGRGDGGSARPRQEAPRPRAPRQGQALQRPCPGGGVHLEGQGAQAIRVRLQSRPRRELQGRVGFGGAGFGGQPL